jgi:DNA-binding SARP family transcriptional activator
MGTEFNLLGEVQVRVDDRAVELAPAHSPKVLCILAVLLRTPGSVVSADSLSDRVWGERLPNPATRYKYVGWLRSALAPHGVPLRNVGGGYMLSVDSSQVDLHRFRALVLAAQRGSRTSEEISALTWSALSLWRGTALSGLSGSWAELFRDQLERERRDAAVLWAGAEIDLGRHAHVLDQLAEWEAEWPADEEIVALRMLALYRSGKWAWALTCYQRAAERISRRLDMRTGHQLHDLYQRIQARDHALAADGARAADCMAGVLPHGLPLGHPRELLA